MKRGTSFYDRPDPELRAALREASQGSDPALSYLDVANFASGTDGYSQSAPEIVFPYEANLHRLVTGRHLQTILHCAAQRLLPHWPKLYKPREGVLAPALHNAQGQYLGRVALFFDSTSKKRVGKALGLQVETHHSDPNTFLRQGIRLITKSHVDRLASDPYELVDIELFGGLDRQVNYSFSQLHTRPLFSLDRAPTVPFYNLSTVALTPSSREASIAGDILRALSMAVGQQSERAH